MAYRQLCAVTFAVLGLVASGCGSGPGNAVASGSGDGQAPSNADQPPSSSGSDQAPVSSDQGPPSSETAPPSSEVAAGTGGGLGALCQSFCQTIADLGGRCADNMLDLETGICDGASACQVPANTPCQAELAEAFRCLIDGLAQVCTMDQSGPGNGNGNAAKPAGICQDVLNDVETCAQAHGAITDGGGTQQGCFAQGGCHCDDDCMKCQCEAGTDIDKLVECASSDACTQ